MKLPSRILAWLDQRTALVAARRLRDFVVGGDADPYLVRWWIIPRNPAFNIYLHEFRRSDDDRAHHDHPWWSLSIILSGRYLEHRTLRDGSQDAVMRHAGAMILCSARAAHPVELVDGEPAWTLFLTGPRIRQWGFLCPNGWRHWRVFTDPKTGGSTVGRGCE